MGDIVGGVMGEMYIGVKCMQENEMTYELMQCHTMLPW